MADLDTTVRINLTSGGDGLKKTEDALVVVEHKAAAAAKKIGSAAKAAGEEQGKIAERANRTIFSLAQGLEDLQYGWRGFANNLPQILLGAGLGAGAVGAISIASTAAAVLYNWFSKSEEKAEELTDETKQAAQAARALEEETARVRAGYEATATAAALATREIEGQLSALKDMESVRTKLAALELAGKVADIEGDPNLSAAEKIRGRAAAEMAARAAEAAEKEAAREKERALLLEKIEAQEAQVDSLGRQLEDARERAASAGAFGDMMARLRELQAERTGLQQQIPRAEAARTGEAFDPMEAALGRMVPRLAEVEKEIDKLNKQAGALQDRLPGLTENADAAKSALDAVAGEHAREVDGLEQLREQTRERIRALRRETESAQELLRATDEVERKRSENAARSAETADLEKKASEELKALREAENEAKKRAAEEAKARAESGGGPDAMGGITEGLREVIGGLAGRGATDIADSLRGALADALDARDAATAAALTAAIRTAAATPSGRRFDAELDKLIEAVEELRGQLANGRSAS